MLFWSAVLQSWWPRGAGLSAQSARVWSRGGLCRWPYHAGRSDDLRVAVEAVVRWCGGAESASESTPPPQPLFRGERGAGRGTSRKSDRAVRDVAERQHPAQVPRRGWGKLTTLGGGRLWSPILPSICLAVCERWSGPLNRGYDRHFTKLLIEHVQRQSELRPDFAPLPSTLPRSL